MSRFLGPKALAGIGPRWVGRGWDFVISPRYQVANQKRMSNLVCQSKLDIFRVAKLPRRLWVSASNSHPGAPWQRSHSGGCQVFRFLWLSCRLGGFKKGGGGNARVRHPKATFGLSHPGSSDSCHGHPVESRPLSFRPSCLQILKLTLPHFSAGRRQLYSDPRKKTAE